MDLDIKSIPLFSVVILSYENHTMLFNTIRSVLIQDYPRIQLIISDDGSSNFDEVKIFAFYESLNCLRPNPIEDFQMIHSATNTGTVKNLFRGYKLCKGEYVTQIAGDDQYHDKYALKNYALVLAEAAEDVCGVYGIAYRCNEKLVYENAGEVIDANLAFELSSLSSLQQYGRLCSYCHFPMGATAFLKEKLDRVPKITDRYIMLEDWPLFIRITRMGWRLIYFQEPILDYRLGGVSQSNEISSARIQCFLDTKELFESEILPNGGLLATQDFFAMASHYDYLKSQITKVCPGTFFLPRFQYFVYNFRGALFYFWHKLLCLVSIRRLRLCTVSRFLLLIGFSVMLWIVWGLFSLFFICFLFLLSVVVYKNQYKKLFEYFWKDFQFLFSRK